MCIRTIRNEVIFISRPKKCRRVGFVPEQSFFSAGCQVVEEEVVEIEELEAIRLSDLMNMDQDRAAEVMEVSRGTYQRILNSARQKIASALINGKSIRIHGGNYQISEQCSVRKECGKPRCERWKNGVGCRRAQECGVIEENEVKE